MLSIKEFIYKNIWAPSERIFEMATISKNEKWGNYHYRIAVHGEATKDRENPHIHIYLSNDVKPYNLFNFEISLTDILSYDEINLIYQRDKSVGKIITNRNKCSWKNYSKIKEGFENWLFDNNVKIPGDFIDNLDAIIWWYNEESTGNDNYILKYIKNHGMKVLNKYKKYFSKEDIDKYEDCF